MTNKNRSIQEDKKANKTTIKYSVVQLYQETKSHRDEKQTFQFPRQKKQQMLQ